MVTKFACIDSQSNKQSIYRLKHNGKSLNERTWIDKNLWKVFFETLLILKIDDRNGARVLQAFIWLLICVISLDFQENKP